MKFQIEAELKDFIKAHYEINKDFLKLWLMQT